MFSEVNCSSCIFVWFLLYWYSVHIWNSKATFRCHQLWFIYHCLLEPWLVVMPKFRCLTNSKSSSLGSHRGSSCPEFPALNVAHGSCPDIFYLPVCIFRVCCWNHYSVVSHVWICTCIPVYGTWSTINNSDRLYSLGSHFLMVNPRALTKHRVHWRMKSVIDTKIK